MKYRLTTTFLLATTALMLTSCIDKKVQTNKTELQSITASEEKMLSDIILPSGKRSVNLPMTENSEDSATVVKGSVEIEIPFNISKTLLDKAGTALSKQSSDVIQKLKAKASITAKAEVKYERFYQFVYRINADKRTEYDNIFKTVTLNDGTEAREFNVEFVNTRQHVMYCETGIKFESIKGLEAEFELLNVSTGAKLELANKTQVGQYSGNFKLIPGQPISFYKDICRIYSNSLDDILTKEFKISLIENLREAVMVPAKNACTIPVDTPEYRAAHEMTPAESFVKYRAHHSDPSCEYILDFTGGLVGSDRKGRCVSSNITPYGHCERRSQRDAFCNLYKLPNNTIATERNQTDATRTFPFDFPDCDEALGLKCQSLEFIDSLPKLSILFPHTFGISNMMLAMKASNAQVGVCR